MTRGGKRPGAGRKLRVDKTERRVAVYLDAEDNERLTRLEVHLRMTASDVMRHALRSTHARLIVQTGPGTGSTDVNLGKEPKK